MGRISDFVSENHRRAISIRLAALDDALVEFENWADGDAVHSVFTSETNQLTDKQRKALNQQATELREILEQTREDLGLTVKENSVAHAIWARCSFLWDTLVELEARHLKQYGAVPEPLARYLEPKVSAIIERVEAISDTVKK